MATIEPAVSAVGPLYTCYCFKFGVFMELLTVGKGGIPDSFTCLLNAFHPIRMPCPTLMGGYVCSLSASCHAMCSWYHQEACSFLKGNRGVVNMGVRGEGDCKTGGCNLYISYERIIHFFKMKTRASRLVSEQFCQKKLQSLVAE